MHKVFSLFIIFCLLLNNVPLVFAASNRGSCNVSAMLGSSQNGQWLNLSCLRQVTTYIKNHPQEKRNRRTVCMDAADRIVRHSISLLRQGQTQQGRSYEEPLRKFSRAAGLPRNVVCVTLAGKQVPCSPGERTRTEVINGVRGQEQVPPEGADVVVEETDHFFDFIFTQGTGTSDPELTNKIKRLAKMNKDELYGAISVMVVAGSADFRDPDYVHPLILNAAFFLYAKKITPAEQGFIEAYLNPQDVFSGIDSKYADKVRLAAANALFAFAQNNPAAVESKFSLSSSYGTVQNTLSASGVMAGAVAIPVSLTFWELFAAEAAAAGGEMAASIAQFSAAMQAAAASTAEAGMAVVSSGALGAAVVFIGGVALFVYALNDAYSPGYKAAFNRAKAKFWDEVFSPQYHAGVDDSILRVVPVDWNISFAKYGSAEATATNTATCQNKEPQEQCEKITWKQSKSYFSSPESPMPVGRLNAYLRDNLGNTFTNSSSIKDMMDLLKRKGLQGDRPYQMFDFISRNCDSFKNSKGGTAFPRPVEKGGALVPDVEVGINIGNTPLTKVLSEGIISILCLNNAYLKEIIELGDGRWIRNTDHEKNGNHFHYQKGPCNHSFNFTGDSFINQMRAICAARS